LIEVERREMKRKQETQSGVGVGEWRYGYATLFAR